MLGENRLNAESFATLLALVGFFSRVGADVLLEVVLVGKGLLAVVAHKGLEASVDPHMQVKVALVFKRLSARRAREWPFASVRPPVPGQVTLVTERLIAVVTLVAVRPRGAVDSSSSRRCGLGGNCWWSSQCGGSCNRMSSQCRHGPRRSRSRHRSITRRCRCRVRHATLIGGAARLVAEREKRGVVVWFIQISKR